MATGLRLHTACPRPPAPLTETACAYDMVAATYLDHPETHANGPSDPQALRSFTDRALWNRLDAMLVRMRTEGRRAIRILDAGCGPGTWLLRLVIRARDMGFAAIDARGIDLSPAMIDLARTRASSVDDAHIGIRFEVGDIVDALDEEDERSFDIVLCLNGVLNHLEPADRSRAAAAMERICDGEIFVTVHSIGGPPSTDLARARDVREFQQDNEKDRLGIDLADGRHLDLPSHLFRAAELPALFSARVRQEELVGLDLFHSRFGSHPRWNPDTLDSRARNAELDRLEQLCEEMPALIDSAAQVLFHGRTS